MSDRDYYEVLGLTPHADGAMVDQAYWHHARKYQALATTNERGRRLLDELNEAYGVLGNSRLRKEYDAFRADVLVGQGVLAADAPTPRARRGHPKVAESEASGKPLLPAGIGPWLLAAGVAAAGIAGAVALARPEIGGIGVAVALVLALAPALTRRLASVNLSMPSVSMPSVSMPSVSMPDVSMPSLPQVSMPEVRTPKLNLAGVGERLGRSAERDAAIDPDELRASTSAVIARWRTNMGLRPSLRDFAGPGTGAPSTELVEIVESERQLDENESEPLMAVIDILRGAHKGERASLNEPE